MQRDIDRAREHLQRQTIEVGVEVYNEASQQTGTYLGLIDREHGVQAILRYGDTDVLIAIHYSWLSVKA